MAIQIQNQLKQNLEIDINLRKSNEEDNNSSYLEVKDNGTGINPKLLMDALTSFGSNNGKSKSDFNFSEHGVGLKLACLRLASSTLIISKTRPVSEFGTTSYYLSIALLSSEFMKKADSMNGYLTAPIVSFEIKNRKITKHLTPEPDHFLQMISNFTRQKFDSGEKILQYALNGIGESGATHIFMFNLFK
jgi:Histidine kinase-, DNA gyrase B-, and HSP90-like ATPase